MGKIMTSFKNMMGFEDEEMYDDYELEELEEEEIAEPKENYSILNRRREAKEPNKVVNLHGNNTKINIIKPNTFDEAPQICESLKANMIVVVNTSSLEPRTAQRLLDFIAGATYALSGDLQEVENGVYVLSPSMVEVTRDQKEESSIKGFLNWK
ncbi:cell division protein SepF [Proteiniclasticum sp. C24MP]|uniref:cell division protein SepF n=1 Tax=Proteiniclasticum sp. C24MP TaxID=3374101 RepID=UPI003754033E